MIPTLYYIYIDINKSGSAHSLFGVSANRLALRRRDRSCTVRSHERAATRLIDACSISNRFQVANAFKGGRGGRALRETRTASGPHAKPDVKQAKRLIPRRLPLPQ